MPNRTESTHPSASCSTRSYSGCSPMPLGHHKAGFEDCQAMALPIDSAPPMARWPRRAPSSPGHPPPSPEKDLVFGLFGAMDTGIQAERGQLLVDSDPPHGLPNAAGHEARSPIPSEVILGLALKRHCSARQWDGPHCSRESTPATPRAATAQPRPGSGTPPPTCLGPSTPTPPQGDAKRGACCSQSEHGAAIDLDLCMGVEAFEFEGPLPFLWRCRQQPAIAPVSGVRPTLPRLR